VLGEYELTGHETALLREAARTVDLIEALQAAVDEDCAAERVSFENSRQHPALGELRLQPPPIAGMRV
jgi:hypothetical protein